jgi:hypothetical protein
MDWNHYRFISIWNLDASPDAVYRVLSDIDSYPLWWPEVRQVSRIDDSSVQIVVRSFLPYDLVFAAKRSRQDPGSGVLETAMHGDLDGFSRWTLSAQPEGTRAVFEEDVIARKALLRSLALIARPLFRANHAVMMRHGREQLGVYLAGYRAGTLRAA